ncbi:MAG: YbhB/YbcL family Raf kinase inhibitor-like protein [Pseudomonadota bacterium]|uniref:YbhB/YbcL family Raf kinase inhibitor-like protein n=1 Tax=Caldimonas aquatica TaxID=376175 RepID=A0ABY6MRC2_9BURK|nr:YbhB/YbcL family Raf kinase inhibitor-like protein [Schlegelella aquatica]UZD54557.1 YbhB/YbcL family Raf kinase inhibitor-like protein [Schlegelella aquatica]
MKLWSHSWQDGARIPAKFAAGRLDDAQGVAFSSNVSPHLAWSEAPAGTRSFVLICHDPDVPSRGDDVNKPDREVPADLPRVDFFHWVLVDLPPGLREIAEGEFSREFTPRGKSGPQTLHGARHGLNDYTGWFAGNDELAGQYFGYDGPFPPFNDARVHRYVFTLYALELERCPVDGSFTGAQVREAIRGHVLAEARFSGTYTLNRRLG